MMSGVQGFETLGKSSAELDQVMLKMKQATEINSERLLKLEQEILSTAKSIQELGALSNNILQSIKTK
jgi:hypothetical protein